MSTVHAIYENGVFRPTTPVELPERCEVEFEPKLVPATSDRAEQLDQTQGMDQIYAILGERYETGETDIAARHNEHQP